MAPGSWAADPAPRGEGVLQVRKLSDGATAYYFRYTAPDGERVRLPIGTALTLSEARSEARTLSRRYQAGERDLRGALEAEQEQAERAKAAQRRATEAEALAKRATLGALLTGYVAHLRRDKKPSAGSVGKALERHVKTEWPALWDMPASAITADDLLPVIARLVDAGKFREASKLRSYIRAAFAAAIRARQDARGLAALRDLKITSNPARDLVTIEGASKARERALSVAELRAYWTRICALPGSPGALLRFHLLTGGQRVRQLARVTLTDYDTDAQTIRLRDTKGRRKVARNHDVPLIPAAQDALRIMRHELGPYLFTLSHGATPAGYESLRDHLVIVRAAMHEAGELEKGDFTVGDLRRTVETRLAAAGLHKDARAQLQSHGLGGVQDRHYDRHEYANEKRAALETLYSIVTGKPAGVTTIKRKRARGSDAR
jgi:hypothetical protein